MTRQVHRGIITQDQMDAGMARIKPAPELQSIGATDLAIEAATENEELKKAIFKALGHAPVRDHALGLQHLLHLDHLAWPRPATGPTGSSACTS